MIFSVNDCDNVGSKPYAISRPFSHEIRFSTAERERKLAGKANGTGYTANSVQCRCFFGTLGDAQDAAARREWRQNFATVQRGVASGVATHPPSVSSVRAHPL